MDGHFVRNYLIMNCNSVCVGSPVHKGSIHLLLDPDNTYHHVH